MNDKPNIILISADSLRANHLGCYGYNLATSPRIDKMASEGVLSEQMFCPVIPTQPSHTTLFTGQSPLRHGVVAHGGKAKLGRSAPFLPELLRDEGYLTCAIDTLFRERMWFARGYEYIIDPSIHHVFYANVTQEELTDRAVRWIKNFTESDPFFLFIHYWDVHYPYVPPKKYREMFYPGGTPIDPNNHALDEWWSHPIGTMARDTWLRTGKGVINDPNFVTGLYDGEVKYLDDGIGNLIESLDAMGKLDNTMIILMADHGESMTEHRVFYDHYGLYDNVIQVPFVVRWPSGNLKQGLCLNPIRQSFDIAPSILEAVGAEIPEEMDGKSFYRQWTGEEEPSGYDRFITMESTWQAKYALRTKQHKFILSRVQDLLGNPMRELYDLKADPLEEKNLVESEPALAAELERELETWISGTLESAGRKEDPVAQEGASMIQIWRGVKSTTA
jgi:arylsulfatase A-like enzyme